MDWEKLLLMAERLIRLTVPDLAGTPIYLVPQAGTIFADSKAAAWTSPRADLMLKEFLGDRWQGRGIGIVLNTALLEKENPALNMETAVFRKVLHETGHAVRDGWALTRQAERDDFPAERIAGLTALVAEHVAGMTWDNDNPSSQEFYGHDEKWLRVCCHLAYRANALGPDYRLNLLGLYMPPIVVIGHRPELSRPEGYLACLGDEPERMIGRPFAEILAEPLPPRFAELWSEDCEEFEKSRSVPAVVLPLPEQESNSMSVLEKVLGKITGRTKAKEKSAGEKYRAIVRDIADDKEPAVDELESVLDAASRSVKDLQADVQKVLRRRQLQTVAQRGAGVAAERSRLDQQRAAAVEVFQQAEKAFRESVIPIDGRLVELDQLESQAQKARGELQADCQDENLAGELAALEAERRELAKRRDALTEQKRKAADEIYTQVKQEFEHKTIIPGTWQRESPMPINPHEVARRLEPAMAAGLHELESNIADLGKNLDAIQERENAIREKMALV